MIAAAGSARVSVQKLHRRFAAVTFLRRLE
jgi:hypothetical protein